MSKEKKLKKGLVAGALGVAMLASGAGVLAGCSGEPGATGPKGDTGAAGLNGATWYSGTAVDNNQGNVGDFFLDTDDSNVYKKTTDGWTLVSNIKGETGKDGVSAYIGYDGYVWNGPEKTQFYASDVTLGEDVVESTLGIEKDMSKYFAGSYVDLSTNTVALMSNYKPNAGVTLYSASKISKISVVAESAGKLHIGKAKVADVVAARTTGTTYTATTTEYDVVEGLNKLTVNLEVAEDETVVLGGQGSVSLYFAKGIDVNDEHGNYTLVNGEEHTKVLSETEGIVDTLAVQVEAQFIREIQVFSDVTNETPDTVVSDTSGPYAFQDMELFAGKKITKIGMYVMSLEKDITQDQTMTVFIIDKSVKKDFRNGTPITVTIPASAFEGCTKTAVNKWLYATDFKDAEGNPLDGITLTDGQSLAFGFNTTKTPGIVDSINWGYLRTKKTEYAFYIEAGTDGGSSLLFDIYVETNIGIEAHLERLNKLETDAQA